MSEEGRLPTVSVVLVTGGGRPILDDAIDAALADPATTELVIVLDREFDAGDEVEARRKRLEERAATEPRLRVVPVPPDTGEGLWQLQRGRDGGAAAARSEVILVLDDDVVLDPGTVTGHARAHADAKDLVLLGYVPVATRHRWPKGDATVRFYESAYEGACERFERDPDRILLSLWICNLSIRREDWLRAIDAPRMHAYGHEDMELGFLFARAGLRGRFDRSLGSVHYYERSLRGFVERAEKAPPSQLKLRRSFPDLVEPTVPTRGRRDRFLRPLVAASRNQVGWRVVEGSLMAGMALAGALRLRRLGDAGASALWFLARNRGMERAGEA